jgi:hypothetical protein
MRAEAKRAGKTVTVRTGGIGLKVFVHKRGEALVPWPDEGAPDRSNQVSEFMALSPSCEC